MQLAADAADADSLVPI